MANGALKKKMVNPNRIGPPAGLGGGNDPQRIGPPEGLGGGATTPGTVFAQSSGPVTRFPFGGGGNDPQRIGPPAGLGGSNNPQRIGPPAGLGGSNNPQRIGPPEGLDGGNNPQRIGPPEGLGRSQYLPGFMRAQTLGLNPGPMLGAMGGAKSAPGLNLIWPSAQTYETPLSTEPMMNLLQQVQGFGPLLQYLMGRKLGGSVV